MKKHALILGLFLLPAPLHAEPVPMDHSHMSHQQMPGEGPALKPDVPREPGQGAFAAIQEIVNLLIEDPATDWSKVNIPALRDHLVDMNNVTLHAQVTGEPIASGVKFSVTGPDEVSGSIKRMVTAHAATMNGTMGYTYETAELPDGAILTVRAEDEAAAARLRGLGFIGVMTLGAHHQEHHLAIAQGASPHHH